MNWQPQNYEKFINWIHHQGVNFIEDWILEIINYPIVVELCIPVNRFKNLYFSISIFVNTVLFYKKKCCFPFLWHYDNRCSTQWNKRPILDIVTDRDNINLLAYMWTRRKSLQIRLLKTMWWIWLWYTLNSIMASKLNVVHYYWIEIVY